jgi:hypothetical protein
MVDQELCIEALKLNPELWQAAQLVSRVRGKTIFPIANLDALIDALRDEGQNHCKLDGVTLTSDHAKQYFPTAFFPIEDEAALLTSLYAALTYGRSVHLLEAQMQRHKQSVHMKGER